MLLHDERREIIRAWSEENARRIVDMVAPWVEKKEPDQECYCCGATENLTVEAVTVTLFTCLCAACAGAQLLGEKGGPVAWFCPTHGPSRREEMEAMLHHWAALDRFNTEFGAKKRGPRVKRGIDWEAKTGALRKEWTKRKSQRRLL